MSTHHLGVSVGDRGAAIVGLERSEVGDLTVNEIERLPADITAVVERCAAVDDAAFVVVDAADLGRAAWAALGERGERWSLYAGRGFDRQALVDRLVVAVHHDALRFAAGLAEMEAMSKALVSYRRGVREDGLIGSELVTALCLALAEPPRSLEPWFVFG